MLVIFLTNANDKCQLLSPIVVHIHTKTGVGRHGSIVFCHIQPGIITCSHTKLHFIVTKRIAKLCIKDEYNACRLQLCERLRGREGDSVCVCACVCVCMCVRVCVAELVSLYQ